MHRVGEIIEQRSKVGLEIRKRAELRERLGNPHPPPFALEPSELVRRMSGPEREPRRITESPAKSRRDRIFRRVHAELASKASVGATHPFDRLQHGARSLQKCSPNPFIVYFSPS